MTQDIKLRDIGYVSLGIRHGEMAHVLDSDAGLVRLEKFDGSQISWRPAIQQNMIAYKEMSLEVSVGDEIRFTCNDYVLGVLNGDRATIVNLDLQNQILTAQKMDGRLIALDLNIHQHLDYGYCSTIHSSQGQTTERIFIDADTKSLTTNENSFYVAISRAKTEAIIYSDDKSALPESMGRDNQKEAALDLDVGLGE